MANKIFFCGGDVRSCYMAEYFSQKGYNTFCYGMGTRSCELKKISEADAVIMGLPAVKDGLVYMPLSQEEIEFERLISLCSNRTKLFGGRFSCHDKAEAIQKGISLEDYSCDEIFQIENALYTAEGTVAKIIENTPGSVGSMSILVVGFGRIANALCVLLKSWPCKLTVYARNDIARARCKTFGIDTVEYMNDLSDFDVIINSVPAHIFTEALIGTVKRCALMVDLSARPGYVDKELCQKKGVKLLYLPGLPLSSAPQAAGIAAAKAVERMWKL